MQVVAGSNEVEFSKEVAKMLNWEIVTPIFKIFDDGESSIRLKDKPAETILIIQSLYHPQDTHLFQLFNLISTCKRLGSKKITVYTPYLAYARSDREILSYEAISSKTIIEILEKIGVNHLITLDVHNPEVFNYANSMQITNLYPVKSIAEYFHSHLDSIDDISVVAPDKGSQIRAQKLAEVMGVEYFVLNKTRDPITGEIEVTTNNADIKTTSVIMVDDIVSTGSSLIHASSLLMIKGVSTIHFFITHFLKSQAYDALQEISDGLIVTTHSVPNLISKISTLKDLCEVIRA